MNSKQKQNISVTMSYALRHNPQEFGLCLDDKGYVNIDEFLEGLIKHNKKCQCLTMNDIKEIVDEDTKQRYEIIDNKIRAFYGHSTKNKIMKVVTSPPDILYHGTNLEGYKGIMNDKCIKSMSRQYVHLSKDIDTAKIVAKRRKGTIIILEVNAKEAYLNGVEFYTEKNGIFLSNPIPIKYVKKILEE